MSSRREIIISSAGGFPFLFCHGVGWLTAAMLSFLVPAQTAALIYLLQGAPALIAALAMQRLLDLPAVSTSNPLYPLLVQLSFLPALAVPALLLLWRSDPALIPVLLAAVFGAHLLPFAWLQRTRVYLFIAALICLIPVLIALTMKGATLHFTGVVVGVTLMGGGVVVNTRSRRHATRAHD